MTERTPERTCIACGEHDGRDDLVRLVAAPPEDDRPARLIVDLRGKLPGRGAWVHPTRACVTTAEREPRKASRVLKQPVDAAGLVQQLEDALLRVVIDGLSLAAAAGAVIGGHDVLEMGLRDGRVVELIFASDAAERTVGDLLRASGDRPVTRLPLDKNTLGAKVGQAPRAALGLVPAPAFRHLRDQLRRLRSMG
ncbi:MAG: YlxR family protein [Myxococcota bacterium]